MDHEIIIVGNGISAKITAIALAKNDFKVCMIPNNDIKIDKHSSNLVTFLSNGSINYLTGIIKDYKIFDQFESINEIKCEIEKNTNSKGQSVNFKAQSDILGKVVENSVLSGCLLDEIQKNQNIHISGNSKIFKINNTETGVKIILDNDEQISSKLLILTAVNDDQLLDNIKVDFIRHDFQQDALSIIVRGMITDSNCANQRFTPDGPLAFLPYFHDEASVIWSLKKSSKLLKLNNDELKIKLEEKLHKLISIKEITSIEKFTLSMNFAKKLFDKNIIIMGNIAHNIHPIAGQGLNLSIKDTAQLIKSICKYRNIGYEINNHQILADYDYNRKLDNTAYSFGTLALDNIFSSRNKILNFVTSKGLKFVDSNKYIKNKFVNSATGKDFFKNL